MVVGRIVLINFKACFLTVRCLFTQQHLEDFQFVCENVIVSRGVVCFLNVEIRSHHSSKTTDFETAPLRNPTNLWTLKSHFKVPWFPSLFFNCIDNKILRTSLPDLCLGFSSNFHIVFYIVIYLITSVMFNPCEFSRNCSALRRHFSRNKP